MEISDDLLTVFSAEVDSDGETFTIEVPKREIELGQLALGETYRLAVLSSASPSRFPNTDSDTGAVAGGGDPSDEPPVETGDIVDCEIESLGDQGDGIAKIGPGFVVIVPDTEVGEQVSVRISEVKDTVAFAEVVERHAPPSVGR